MTEVPIIGETKVNGLGNAIKHVEEKAAQGQLKANEFATAFKELTGKMPNEPCNALDVVKIVHKMYGEPTA